MSNVISFFEARLNKDWKALSVLDFYEMHDSIKFIPPSPDNHHDFYYAANIDDKIYIASYPFMKIVFEEKFSMYPGFRFSSHLSRLQRVFKRKENGRWTLAKWYIAHAN
jgi:hypothetical protein